MAVTAGDSHSRLRQTQFRPDDVHDALRPRTTGRTAHARRPAVPLERREHVLGHHVDKRPPLIERRHDVIDGGDRALRIAARPTRAPAACRTPAASSPRESDAARRTAASVRSATSARCAHPTPCRAASNPLNREWSYARPLPVSRYPFPVTRYPLPATRSCGRCRLFAVGLQNLRSREPDRAGKTATCFASASCYLFGLVLSAPSGTARHSPSTPLFPAEDRCLPPGARDRRPCTDRD